MMRHWFYFFSIFICFIFLCDGMMAQHYYHGHFKTLYSVDRNNCLVEEVFKMDASYGEFIQQIAFHPNGRMYATATAGLMEIDPVTWNLISFLPWSQIIPPSFYYYLFFDENGVGWISAEANTGPGGRAQDHLYFYDARDQRILRDKIYPQLVAGTLGLYGKIGKYYLNSQQNSEKFRLLDLETMTYVTKADWPEVMEDGISAAALEYRACQDVPYLLTTGENTNSSKLLTFNVQTSEVLFPCENQEILKLEGGAEGTTTDFRQSALRIDLDGDNSSGHITAGYYDTLTSCRNEVPVMDEDMELYTCGAAVDYISFRLKYYDDPLLTEEIIYSDGFSDPELTSSGWYVWQNTYGIDENKIKEYLRSLRYRVTWTNPDEKERVVMTTMHVGNDSTTSWSVYQLEADEVYAGRDTMITFCSPEGVIDVVEHLSSGAGTNGRLDPEPAGGGTWVDLRVDQGVKYLYIVEKGNCKDTAVIQLNHIKAPEDPEPVVLCSGQGLWYNLPPASYSEINWWDGSHGDSIWLETSRDTVFYVETVVEDTCTWLLRVPVRVREVNGLAGEDQTLTFCAGVSEIELNALLPDARGMDQRLEPFLSGRDLIFRPSEDAPGEYLYILSIGSCADTALITMEESTTGEISFDTVRLCGGSEVKVGLPPEAYHNIRWWNGDSGDSTTISTEEPGPYTLEAEKDGCTYQGEVPVDIVPKVVIPDGYPDQVIICDGQPRVITVSELDSVKWMDAIYYHGDEISINQEGEYNKRGYRDGCYAEKSISVNELADPSAGYTKTIEWCPQSALTISLPDDNANWTFQWKDGHDSSSRAIDSTGHYPFLITSDSCKFTGFYDVIESPDCNDKCIVSIPNAITPNGDGINDHLEVFSECAIRVIEIRIFDKWGGELYSVQAGEVEAFVWSDLPPGVVMVQVMYETGQGVVKTVGQGVLVVK